MRFIAFLLAFLLAINGLSHARSHGFAAFQSNDAQPLTLAVLCHELAGREGERHQPDPTGAADEAGCADGQIFAAALSTAQRLGGGAATQPHLRRTATANPARAPPAQNL